MFQTTNQLSTINRGHSKNANQPQQELKRLEIRNDASHRPQLAPVQAPATGRSGCRWCPASPLWAESGRGAVAEKARGQPRVPCKPGDHLPVFQQVQPIHAHFFTQILANPATSPKLNPFTITTSDPRSTLQDLQQLQFPILPTNFPIHPTTPPQVDPHIHVQQCLFAPGICCHLHPGPLLVQVLRGKDHGLATGRKRQRTGEVMMMDVG